MSQVKSGMLSKGLNVPQCAHSVLVSFAGVSKTFEMTFVYKEHLPNHTDYIILGQRVCVYLIKLLDVVMIAHGKCSASH